MKIVLHIFYCILLFAGISQAEVLINEIHYDPEPDTEALEFVELYNSGSAEVDAGGWYFSDGIEYTFPSGTLIPARGYLVIAQDPTSFSNTF